MQNRIYHYVLMNNRLSPLLCTFKTLQWRHDGRDSVANHQPRKCLLSRLIRRKSRKTSKLRVTGLGEGNSPETGEFPAQRASKAEMFPFDDVIMNAMITHSLVWYGRIILLADHLIWVPKLVIKLLYRTNLESLNTYFQCLIKYLCLIYVRRFNLQKTTHFLGILWNRTHQ